MRSLRTAALLICFVTSGLLAQESSQDWRFAHPGATLVGGFRLKATLDSPLVNALIAQATAKDPSAGPMVAMMKAALSGVTEVRFSVRDMGKGKDPDVLALVSGVLDDTTANALMAPKTKTTLHRIDANTVLMGQGQSLEDALDRMRKPAVALQDRALDRGKAIAHHDLWMAGSLPAMPMTFPVLDSLRGLAFGLTMQKDLNVEVAVEMATPKMAEDLVSSARKSQAQQPASVGAALHSEVDGSTARFQVVMEGDQLLQAARQAMEGNTGSSPLAALLGGSSSPAPQFAESTPAKPKRDTIMIYGLEDGPREIKPAR